MKKLLMTALMLCTIPLLQAESPPVKKYEALNFDNLLGNVDGLNDDLLKTHFKLYQGYVNNTNILLEKIAALNVDGKSTPPEFAGFKHMLGWEYDGMVLHELYFGNLGGGKQTLKSDSPLMQKIVNDYGSYDNWKNDFVSTGTIRGIGWVILYQDPKSDRLINTWIGEHDLGHLAGGTPILVMDVWEHAYITQFSIDRAQYIKVFFDNINWKTVTQRYQSANHIEPDGGVIIKF